MMEGQAAPAPETGGSTILTGGAPAGGMQGVPPADVKQEQTFTATQAERASQRPDWVHEKFWDAETGQPKYEEMGRSYMNLEKLIGRDKVPVPQSDDDKDGWDRWYKASGRPEKPDEYEFKRPDALPDGLNYDEDLEKSYRETVYELGLNKRQAAILHERYVKAQTDRAISHQNMMKENRAKIEADIRREYGASYDAKVARAKEAIQTFADPEYLKWLDETGSGNDPRVIRAWIKVGEKMGGDTKLKGAPDHSVNPVNHQKAIDEFRAKNEKALWDKSHPNHDRLVNELNEMYGRAFG